MYSLAGETYSAYLRAILGAAEQRLAIDRTMSYTSRLKHAHNTSMPACEIVKALNM